MRITRETLLKLAKDTVAKRLAPDPNVSAVFLVGSLRPEDASVESAADIDLLVIYTGEPLSDREIIKLSNEYHLDIAYENASRYAQPRELRGDPWRGWAMWDPCLLYQKKRFFEYTQSIVRAQFDDPGNLLLRARAFSVPAREAWFAMQMDPSGASPQQLLEAVYNAANALVTLGGAPIPERRLLAEFPARAQQLGQEEMIQPLFASAFGQTQTDQIRPWLASWEAAFLAAAQAPRDARLHPARVAYYKTAITSQLEGDLPAAALWPLLQTWALAAESGALTPEQAQTWAGVRAEMGLNEAAIPERLQALDTFLDGLEERLEQMALENGIQ